ncbi:MAG: hypothetical protein ABF991_00715 [Liquorilactobacillus hordei]|uniref:hypothetical protein n=1 Tax=Liquorilactobacillus hordei TaxID=468911 RepID=UPI0039ED6A4E
MGELEGKITFDGISKIISQIDKGVEEVVTVMVRRAAEEILKEILTRDFPAGAVSEYYVRSGEMADTVKTRMTSMGRNVSFLVYIDSNELGMYPPLPHQWGHHMDVHGNDFRQGLPIVLDQGGHSSIYAQPARHFMEQGFTQMIPKLILVLAEGLRSRGFETVIE